MLKFLSGKKTYLTAAISVGYAVFGYLNHNLDAASAFQVAQVAIMGTFIRSGVASAAK